MRTPMTKPHLYLIRGLPGSGKTTLAHNLCAAGLVDYLFSADDYFYNDYGEYIFQPRFLGDAHKQCQARTRMALDAGRSAAVHNTFTQRWEMEPYFQMPYSRLIVLVCEGDFGSVHNVPQSAIDKMRARWEPFVNSTHE